MDSGGKSKEKGNDRGTETENKDGSGCRRGITEGSQKKGKEKLHGTEAGWKGNRTGKQKSGAHGSKDEEYRKRKAVCKHTGDQVKQALHEEREKKQKAEQLFVMQDTSGFFLKQSDLFLKL